MGSGNGEGNVILLDHALALSIGYRSGRSSWRETPEMRSTSSTRSGGTSSHCATACLEILSEAASLVSPPAPLMARTTGVSDMVAMSSTASQESQATLHLQRQAVLYHIDMTLGNLIRKAREAKKMTLQALADKVGVSKQLVWQWEKGESDARTHIKALSVHLEQPVEYFYATKRSPAVMEAKFRLLSPEQQAAVNALMDAFLSQREADEDAPVKRA